MGAHFTLSYKLIINMKIVACYILHYGKEWLEHSMRSVAPFVDEFVIAYTDRPSHGHGTHFQCPDKEEELIHIVDAVDNRALWFKRRYAHEGEHRTTAVNVAKAQDAGIVLVVDADEIWEPEHLSNTLSHVEKDIILTGGYHSYRVAFRHFWKSVDWVCNDPAMPTRIIVPSQKEITQEGYIPQEFGKVNHFGYAQSPDTVWYKMQIHGHKAEWRPEWWEEKFKHWDPSIKDVHPTNKDFWNPEYFDKTRLSDLIGDHYYYDRGIIRW